MKIVDQTPFYKENGELSGMDRARAVLQFGLGWFKEIEAQKSVIAVLKKNLDKNYTLLCNVIPPGLEARIPLILVGPTGVYVMCVTPKVGMFRARGDQWGTISGSSLKPENPNLLTRTGRMARAIQVYLQRRGFAGLVSVEAILFCSNPTTNVDSMRPIIRVIMRDTFERFAVSIAQARIVLTPESALNIVNLLQNSPPPASPEPIETANPESVVTPPAQPGDPQVALFALPEAGITPPAQSDDPYVPTFVLPEAAAAPASAAESFPPAPVAGSEVSTPAAPRLAARLGLTNKQIALLVGMAIILCLLVVVFAFLVAKNMNPPLLMLK